MMKKALIITTVSGFVPQFEMNNVKILQKLGYEVHYASNFKNPFYGKDNSRLKNTNIFCHQVDFERSPYKLKSNWNSYKQLMRLEKENSFDLVHCHTPMGGALGRLVFGRDKRCKCVYTAHGFHFFKGAPLKNWLLYYPIEKWLSKYTDVIITINKEDYKRAKGFYAKKVEYVPGVGIDTGKFRKDELIRNKIRKKYGLHEDTIILLSVGELNKGKNHKAVIKALRHMDRNICYFICGKGNERKYLEGLVKRMNLEDRVFLLGYVRDIYKVYQLADIFVFPSLREGLPVSLMEAMSCGLPCIVSNIRGNRELVKPKKGGVLLDSFYSKALEKALKKVKKNMGGYNRRKIKNCYSKERIVKKMRLIYEGEGTVRND